MTFYPSIEDAIGVHARLIARFGGSLGIRDRGALESALARPQIGYYQDLVQEAAALWESLSQNHPFIAAFLKVNGYRLDFDDLEAYSFLIGLYERGAMNFTELETWLRQYVTFSPVIEIHRQSQSDQ